jgi:tRNA uridine 5-carboxymethylaminomethyl modification enzyme
MGARVVIVGGGHAGLEAAFAASRVGVSVVVITGRVDTIGQTPCNPSVGGVAKGHLVAEIEALGGFMGRAADACAIQGRVLNRSKGPAVRATRLQVDKDAYGQWARDALVRHPGIEVVEGFVRELSFDANRTRRVHGVRLVDGTEVTADAVVVTTGTFLGGLMHVGRTQTPGGRVGEAPATHLSQQLAALGFDLKRLKTGTPPRLDRNTIDFAVMQSQPSEDPFPRFTAPDEPDQPRTLDHVDCHLTYTNPETHDVIRGSLDHSPMFSGQIEGRGPRYCPSIEDKVVRFADRERHQIFVEPEGLHSDLVYPNGISTSLPVEAQEALVATIAGLEKALIVRPGYAVEYDAVDARSLDHRLASKDHEGLFFAGQVNGTSGYEEAGAQGLLAGANAALQVVGRERIELARDQAYAGVLVDDLVTQGCDEPYRMFTSRAEYRLILREDNADERLADVAFAASLIDQARLDRVRARQASVELAIEDLGAARRSGQPPWIVAKAESRRIYAGYLERQQREIDRIRGDGASDLPLSAEIDYFSINGLTRESAERLARVRPTSTGQAARIPGMTPAALMTVWAYARARGREARVT